MLAVVNVVLIILNLFVWVLIIQAVLSWLIAFNVVNMRNQFVDTIYRFTYQLTEPFLRPIRRIVPQFNGLDLSFLVLWLIIIFLQNFIQIYVVRFLVNAGL